MSFERGPWLQYVSAADAASAADEPAPVTPLHPEFSAAQEIEIELGQLGQRLDTHGIADETSVAFAEASAGVNKLITRTLLIAQRAVEAALSEAEQRAQMLIDRAEEHARIVSERARKIIDEGLEQQQQELTLAVTQSHARLLQLLDEALRRLDDTPGNIRTMANDDFLAELRQTLSDLPGRRL